jgi:uncharacterized protein (DUF58 family)
LELKARRVVEGFLAGMHRSPYFGQSIEFLQHRQYTRGDEIRHIDWKVYARQDRLHIKQYEEETNLRLTLLVDRSASMSYGEGDLNKFDYSASIAACLSYLALRQKDATGLYTFDTAVRATVPAKSNQQQLARILSMLDSVGADGRTDLTRVAKQVAQGIPRRGLVLIISDLLGVDNLMEGLRVLRQRGHDVVLFHVLHDDEMDFQFNGATRFEGLETEDMLNSILALCAKVIWKHSMSSSTAPVKHAAGFPLNTCKFEPANPWMPCWPNSWQHANCYPI